MLHPLDRDRFRASLDGVIEQRRGRLTQDFRLRAADGHYVWFSLKARPVVGSDGEVVRLVGTLTDVTEFKNAEERLLFDAVHDNLTGLPNRELFLDRMEAAFAFARSDTTIRPSVLVIDLDRFKQVNDSVGIAVGDSILLTIARRLARLLKPHDTLARLSGDQFAAILMSEKEPARIVAFVETMRRALRAPIAFNDREIFLTASVGLALAESQPHRTEEVLKDAELAMYYAKRVGGDRIEIFKPAMRSRKTDRLDDGIGIAPRHRARGDQDPLPADRAPRGPADRRVSRRWRAGITRNWGACRRPNSSPSPRKSGSSSTSACSCSSERPGNWRSGSTPIAPAIRCSRPSTYRRGNCCATT